MSCLNNVYVTLNKGEYNERVVQVRCRHCEDCKQSSRSSAIVRLHYEDLKCTKLGGMCFFVTLTFADEYVPFKFQRMCFDKKLVQDWLQKFRQVMRRHYGYRVKYLIVSELGYVGTHRPHHHGKIYLYPDRSYQLKSWQEGGKHFNEIPKLPITYAAFIRNCWIYGRADVQEFDPYKGGNDYVSKYISKDVAEDNLFKDIITRIQMKRGKGNPEMASKYYSSTFPSLFAFMNRYCPFTMISKGLGEYLNPSRKDLVEQKPVSINGFNYAMPRYYVDRYVRNELKDNQELVVHKPDLSDCGVLPNSLFIRCNGFKRYVVPCYIDYSNDRPTERILRKYRRRCNYDLFDDSIYYAPMPFYKTCYSYSGRSYLRQVMPKQSEVSTLSADRKKFFESLDKIEDLYMSLPDILRNSCNYDVPQILHDSPKLLSDDEFIVYTQLGIDMISELRELSQIASKWRADCRVSKREINRKQKILLNSPYAKKPLSWAEYRVKSQYFNLHFNH